MGAELVAWTRLRGVLASLPLRDFGASSTSIAEIPRCETSNDRLDCAATAGSIIDSAIARIRARVNQRLMAHPPRVPSGVRIVDSCPTGGVAQIGSVALRRGAARFADLACEHL